MENPSADMIAKDPINDRGMVTRGMIVARRERRKMKMTMTTSSVRFGDGLVNVLDRLLDEHRAIVADINVSCRREGRASNVRQHLALASSETSSGLAVACLTMPRKQ